MNASLRTLVAVLLALALVALAAACGDDEEELRPGAVHDTAVVGVWYANVDGDLERQERVVDADEPVRAALEALIEGPPGGGPDEGELLPAVPEGTRLLDTEVRGDVVHVDLSAEFERNYPSGGAAAELAIVGPLVLTATDAAAADAARITVEGRTPAPAGSQFDFSAPLTPEDVGA